MGFCYNCGSRIELGDRFCPICGAAVEGSLDLDTTVKVKDDRDISYGYLFTNLEVLAQKLNVRPFYVREILETYIRKRSRQDVIYSIVDVSCYQPKLSINQRGDSEYRLRPEDGWEVHQRLLLDQYTYDAEVAQKKICYVFIIGGDDVIPMVGIPHFLEQGNTIDTDIPYSFLYGKRTLNMLHDGTLFKLPQMLHASRLPVSSDMGINGFEAYFNRAALVAETGIDNLGVYGQTNVRWKLVSAKITEKLRDYFLPVHIQDEDYVYFSLMVTPKVARNNIQQFFNPEGSFYYFNMHGSDAPTLAGFYGDSCNGGVEGIGPSELASIQNPNIVVTEACFGARYIRKTQQESMLLAAINNQTVLYLGSSRIAYGSTDYLYLTDNQLRYADVVAQCFLQALYKNQTAGEALLTARCALMSNLNISPYHLVTITEFNLFGDPALAPFPKKQIHSKEQIEVKTVLCPHAECMDIKIIYECQSRASLLDRIRQSVNRNMQQIVDLINRELYVSYGIKPRSLSQVIEVRTASGNKSMFYQFIDENDGKIIVKMNENHQILEILTSKR